jgi:hypothetical protein
VFIGPARAIVQFLNQAPLVAGLHLGVRDLDVLLALHSFGVAAVPILLWALALVLQFRGPLFWPLAVLYATAFLTSGFIAVGEYTYAFALSAVVVSVLGSNRALRPRQIVPLVLAATALVLAYEGMMILGIPLVALVGIRLLMRRWLTTEQAGRGERIALWYSLVCLILSGLVAAAWVLIRMRDSADTNLAGAMDVQFALQANRQWQVAFVLAVLLILSTAIRHTWSAAGLQMLAAAGATLLYLQEFRAPAWMHYNTRSLSTYTFVVLLVLALALVILDNRRTVTASSPDPARPDLDEPRPNRRAAPFLGLGVAALVVAMSFGFVVLTRGYGLWLGALEDTVQSGQGPLEILPTGLYAGESSQFSWGWTNPYTSVLLQTEHGQGVVLSHVDTLGTYIGITPPSTPEFFRTYHRAAGD